MLSLDYLFALHLFLVESYVSMSVLTSFSDNIRSEIRFQQNSV